MMQKESLRGHNMIPETYHKFENNYNTIDIYLIKQRIQKKQKVIIGNITNTYSDDPRMSILGIMGLSRYCTLLNDLRKAGILKEFNWRKFSYINECSLQSFIDLLKVNIDNKNLSDKRFRSVIKNSMHILEEAMSKKEWENEKKK